MTKQQAIELIEEANRLLTEIDDRASVIASERRRGKFGEGHIEFRIRLWVEKATILGSNIDFVQEFTNGYVLSPLPTETRK